MNYAAILQGILQEELGGKPPLQNVRLDLPSLKSLVASLPPTGVLYGLVEGIMAGAASAGSEPAQALIIIMARSALCGGDWGHPTRLAKSHGVILVKRIPSATWVPLFI